MSIQKNKKEKLIEDEEQPITEEKKINEKKEKSIVSKSFRKFSIRKTKKN